MIFDGSNPDFVTDKPTRGRPKRSPLEKARGAYWALAVQMAAGKDFASIERELSSKEFKPLAGGGYDQPHAWSKYARGARTPEPPACGVSSPVLRAEKQYPGTLQAYTSITWDLLYPAHNPPKNPLQLAGRVAPYVLERIESKHIAKRDGNRILLTDEAVARVALIKHIDALGLLLMQWRNGDREQLSILHVFYSRLWLLHAFEFMPVFAKCKSLIVRVVEENVSELGVLEGIGGLGMAKTMEERYRDAVFAGALAGVPLGRMSST